MKKESKNVLINIVIFVTVLLATSWTAFFLDYHYPIFIIIFSAAVYYLYRQIFVNKTLKPNWKILIFTFLFSIAFIMGKQVNYVYIRSSMQENYITLDIKACLSIFTFCAIIFPIFNKLTDFILSIKTSDEKKEKIIKDLPFFFIAWLSIIICWMPYLLSFYPGAIVGDGAKTLKFALTPEWQLSNHWIVLYILVLRFFFWLGRFFTEDINFGVFLYVCTEYLVFSCVCAFVAYKLRKKGAPVMLQWGTVLMYAISGFFASYGITLWKDGIFSAAVILLILLLWDMPLNKKLSVGYCVKFGLIGLFLCFWRNNGIYVVAFTAIFVLIIIRKQALRLLIPSIIVIVCTLVIQGPVYDALNIKKDNIVESLSVPIQKVAAVIGEGRELKDSQKEILFNIISEEDWKNAYTPTLSDDLKNASDREYLTEHAKDFLVVWAQLLIPNFKIYVKAYMMLTLGYWQPGVYHGSYLDYWLGIQDFFEDGYVNTDLLYKITGRSFQEELTSIVKFVPSGTAIWFMWYAFTVILSQKEKRKKKILIFLPLIASWIVVMIATPIAYSYRYVLMIPMSIPIMCYLPFCKEEESAGSQ